MQTKRKGVVQVKAYGEDNFKITVCNTIISGEKSEREKKQTVKKGEANHEEKLSHSLSRTRNKILEYGFCNDWYWFVTLTLDKEKYQRDNLPKFIKDLGQFIRDQRKKYGLDIKYLLIPELHADGKNWHMHGLLTELPTCNLAPHPLDKEFEKGYLIWEDYMKKFGYCSVGAIRDKKATASYILKYISKDITKTAVGTNKKLYYCSRGLKTAEKVAEGQLYKPLNFNMAYEGLYTKSTFVDSYEWFKPYYIDFNEKENKYVYESIS